MTTLANGWLGSLTGNGPKQYGLFVITSDQSQDFLVIPEPATIAFIELGIVGLIRRRRK